jgi:hypothetical protein
LAELTFVVIVKNVFALPQAARNLVMIGIHIILAAHRYSFRKMTSTIALASCTFSVSIQKKLRPIGEIRTGDSFTYSMRSTGLNKIDLANVVESRHFKRIERVEFLIMPQPASVIPGRR